MNHSTFEHSLELRSRDDFSGQLQRIKESIEHAAVYLPSQGPLSIFVYENPLQAYEDLTFKTATKKAGHRFGGQCYYTEQKYRHWVTTGRILKEDLADILREELGAVADDPLADLGTYFQTYLAMLQNDFLQGTGPEIQWAMEETLALRHFSDDIQEDHRQHHLSETRKWVTQFIQTPELQRSPRQVELLQPLLLPFLHLPLSNWSEDVWEELCLKLIWQLSLSGVRRSQTAQSPDSIPLRHRDLIKSITGQDTDELVHKVLIRYCASFVDQGYARWELPVRSRGFFEGFLSLYRRSRSLTGWLKGFGQEIERLIDWKLTPLESIYDSLRLLGVSEQSYQEYLTQTMLSLRGWAGMIWQLETRASWALNPAPRGTLLEFVAVHLLLDRFAIKSLSREIVGASIELCDLHGTLQRKIPHDPAIHEVQHAFQIFQLAQYRGWRVSTLFEMSDEEWQELITAVEEFGHLERRYIFQCAFEKRYHTQAMDALCLHGMQLKSAAKHTHDAIVNLKLRRSFQLVTCIDDREESFRRHLEEICPACQTFGSAGFFGVPMYYQGAGEAHFRPLCPVVVTPRHYVREVAAYSLMMSSLQREKTRRRLGNASHQWHLQSRSFIGGILTAILGPLASIPTILRILFPRLVTRVGDYFGGLIKPPPVTELILRRSQDPCSPEEGHMGHTVQEMSESVERVLSEIGLTRDFARIVFFLGHGSSSLNNPHEAAYNCGACSGGQGGPNARAFSQMANTPEVRTLLARRGLVIPDDVVFIGGMHNTCDDDVSFFDVYRIPVSHRKDFEQARECLEEARGRNARERLRRFETVPLTLSVPQALEHAKRRSADLSEARPEYIHPTNALTIVGRRCRTRGLFLDRRAFLNDYDAKQDNEHGDILARILSAAFPVCGGINLLYYFSTTDGPGFGCGSKLPHNIVSLLGVMEGALGDLRPGLAQQMVEIHEAMRMLFIVETTPQTMLRMIQSNPTIKRLVENEWVKLAVLDYDEPILRQYKQGKFELYHLHSQSLPIKESSREWYHGQRDHLGFSSICVPDEEQRFEKAGR